MQLVLIGLARSDLHYWDHNYCTSVRNQGKFLDIRNSRF